MHPQRRYKLSWWDALIVNSAIQSRARILWTEDLKNLNQLVAGGRLELPTYGL